MQRIRKKSALSALLLYVLTLSQWGAVYVPRDSIRNAALDRKLQLVTIFGNVENAPTFNRTVRWNLQIVCFLALLTHFLPNLYLLLHKISWKSINGMLTVFVQNSWNFVTTFLTLTSTFLLFRNQNYGKLIKLHPLKVTPQSENIKTTSLEAVFYSSSKQTSCLRSYTLSKKLAWRSYPFVSRLLNHLGLISTTSIYPIPQLNIIRSTLPSSNQVLLHSFLAISTVTLKCGTLFNFKTSVVTKFLTGSLIMIYTFLTMALLLELVELLVMIAPPTSPSVRATSQRKHLGD